ncbi:MAG: glycosyltransferase family 2 protein [Lachnospiraceae bacterium]|nr:glycosyltransferase family 2 protein [Lachnospiraceae bacterium]
MKYSVVIPLYNSEKTIIKTLKSVMNQTRLDLIDEIVIVDDGSTDLSVKIINDYIAKEKIDIVKIVSQENKGAASARNKGISLAKNEFIALLDADDEWKKQKLEFQNKIFETNKNVKALGSNREGEMIHLGKKTEEGIFKISPFQYCIKNWPCTPSLIFDKSIFDGRNPFPEDMSHAEEGLFFLELAYKVGLYYLKDELVLCGGGKRAFGASGLSGNIKKMHLGVNEMIKRAEKRGYIKRNQVFILLAYEYLKYIRRKVIVWKEK